MRQCTLVLLAKGQIVSFTFIAGSEDELDDLMDGLHFSRRKAVRHRALRRSFVRSRTRCVCRAVQILTRPAIQNHVPKSNKKRGLRSRFQPQNGHFLC